MEQHIRESNLIEGIDDPKADKQSMKAWKWLETRVGINEQVLLELHKRITAGQLPESESGHFRTIQVYVGNHTPPLAFIVPERVDAWLRNFMLDTPKSAHVAFEIIHPFVDGNGRTGRMLMWWHELKLGQKPTLLLNENKQDYYKWFKADTKGTDLPTERPDTNNKVFRGANDAPKKEGTL
jgi:Fic family protein